MVDVKDKNKRDKVKEEVTTTYDEKLSSCGILAEQPTTETGVWSWEEGEDNAEVKVNYDDETTFSPEYVEPESTDTKLFIECFKD